MCVFCFIAKTEKNLKKNWLTPQKEAFLSFEIKTVKKCSSYFSFILALKTIDAHMLFDQYFCSFSKIPTKRIFVCLLFLKLNLSQNPKKFFVWRFSLKTKNPLFLGSKMVLFTVKFQICISVFVL